MSISGREVWLSYILTVDIVWFSSLSVILINLQYFVFSTQEVAEICGMLSWGTIAWSLACVILSEVVPSGNPKTQKGKSWLDWLRRKSQHGNLNWEIDDKAWRESIVSDKPSYLMQNPGWKSTWFMIFHGYPLVISHMVCWKILENTELFPATTPPWLAGASPSWINLNCLDSMQCDMDAMFCWVASSI